MGRTTFAIFFVFLRQEASVGTPTDPDAGQHHDAQPGKAETDAGEPGFGQIASQRVYLPAPDLSWVDIPGAGPARLGTAGQRIIARIIDSGILLVAVLILARLHVYNRHFVHVVDVNGTKSASIDTSIYGRALLVQLGAYFLYDMVLVATTGSTIGMKIMGIKVVRSTDGQRPTFGSAALRAVLLIVLGSILCGFGFVIIGLSFLWDATKKRQGWHDKTASTLVVVSR